MTLEEIKTELETSGFPVAYGAFFEKQELPFVVFAEEVQDDVMADDEHYQEITNGYVELYTDKKDKSKENVIKAILENTQIAYEKENEIFIEKERMFMVRWSFSYI